MLFRSRTSSTTTLRDALSLMLTEGSTGVIVVGENDQPTGYMTFDVISHLLAESEGRRAT